MPERVKHVPHLNGPDNGIGWTDWTWNPVTGCLTDCRFGPNQTPCYAKAQAERFGLSFAPTFHPERLGAPAKLAARADRPWRIFVCSMADLLGMGVEDSWIEDVLATIRATPRHVYQVLTKATARLDRFEWPDNVWLGVTITGAKRERYPKRLGDLVFPEDAGPVRWVSLEPLVGAVDIGPWLSEATARDAGFTRVSWVVVGGMSGAGAVQPEPAWVDAVDRACDEHGVAVYHKANLRCRQGEQRRMEFPGGEA
jgi:protein gp37